ncbi:MAG: glycosyltransferase [Chlamydiae bacterium]|nr:glycosyltransferase [Chlamydiota bacterium]MBI3278184.1 glycosyltransferase [Chlamydiota bacterium]
MKIALVHDWLNGMRGGEKCLEVLLEMMPHTPIFTLLCEPDKISEEIQRSTISTSWIQKLPFVKSKYRYFLPLFPWAIRNLNLKDCDLVISISHCAAKSVSLPRKAIHVCYCLTPMRYMWGFYDEYFGKGPYHWLKFLGLTLFLKRLQRWDQESSRRVDYFIAISQHVAKRIKNLYGRDSEVIYPPIDTAKFYYNDLDLKEDYFLIVSALVPYKRIDLAIRAFNQTGLPLKIIGAGTEFEKLKTLAGPNIQFLGWVSNDLLRQYYARAQALIFPGEEDFGITPLEAQACGTPVIAFRKGGVLETVKEGETGLFFDDQTPNALVQALEKFKGTPYDREALRQNAFQFRTEIFQQKFKEFFRKNNISFNE